MKPENHVDPPDLTKLLPILSIPTEGPFWTEAGKTVDWLRYLWTGPDPRVEINLRNIYPGVQFSAQMIYQAIIDEVSRLAIPGVQYGREILHESGPFSAYRAYLRIRREFSEYFVCAAPVGSGYFVSVRKIDRFPHVKWFHYLPVMMLLGLIFLVGLYFNGLLGGLIAMALLVSFGWSLCRYAAHGARSWLSEHLPELPVAGPLFMRWFRPDSYYRQDIHAAFLSLVDSAIRRVVEGLEPAPAVRPPAETLAGPIRTDLHRPA